MYRTDRNESLTETDPVILYGKIHLFQVGCFVSAEHRIFIQRGRRTSVADITDLLPSDEKGRLRIIQETVPGNQISLAHVIGSPQPILYQKLGLNPDIDYEGAAIGIMTLCPSETAVIGADIATKSGDIYLGFVDRFAGTLILTGAMSEVENAIQEILDYFERELGFACCRITKR